METATSFNPRPGRIERNTVLTPAGRAWMDTYDRLRDQGASDWVAQRQAFIAAARARQMAEMQSKGAA